MRTTRFLFNHPTAEANYLLRFRHCAFLQNFDEHQPPQSALTCFGKWYCEQWLQPPVVGPGDAAGPPFMPWTPAGPPCLFFLN